MRFKSQYSLILTTLFLSESACTVERSSKVDNQNNYEIVWQNECLKQADAASVRASEVWCLTSNAGADTEQFLLYVSADKKTLDVSKDKAPFIKAPFVYSENISSSKHLSAAEWKSLGKVLATAKTLKDFDDGSFDSLRYTLHYAQRAKSGKLEQKAEWYVVNWQRHEKDAPKHFDVISAFKKL